ncbi:GDSL/SGNH-like acyl-esterase family found in Pmr5 and Cas1p-domain-containing protein [Cunninghamella echinulata]|nr:GDSL/SGNH-like acyl-esterase family found in Pmr5 and Cas1p-domain-containing protein [Cunninghamella echinulata]
MVQRSIKQGGTKSNLTTIYILAIFALLLLWVFVIHHDDPKYELPPAIINNNNNNNNNPSAQKNLLQSPFITTKIPFNQLCDATTYNQGQWVKRKFHVKNNQVKSFTLKAGYHCPQHFAHKCFERNEKELIRSKQIAEWEWKPEQCQLLDMNAYELANHLSKHPLLFVGDSISQLQYESMGCLLGEFMSKPTKQMMSNNITRGDKSIKVSELAFTTTDSHADTSPSLAYIRSDFLLRTDDFKLINPFEKEGDLMGIGHNFPWVHALPHFDYIVINTGAHWHKDIKWGPNTSEEELRQAFKDGMKVVFDHLKKVIKPHQRVWVRSTPYGHSNCSQYKKPMKKLNPPTGQPGQYVWHLFSTFDNIWREWIENEKDPRFNYFDISYMSNLRGDAHSKPDKDCLHFCIGGGPVDFWNQYLYHEIGKNALMEYEKQKKTSN